MRGHLSCPRDLLKARLLGGSETKHLLRRETPANPPATLPSAVNRCTRTADGRLQRRNDEARFVGGLRWQYDHYQKWAE